ncbi:MAG: hypothetical protein ACI8W8_002619 [Rhodothermales bacterium]|jgi:hypothetical protein
MWLRQVGLPDATRCELRTHGDYTVNATLPINSKLMRPALLLATLAFTLSAEPFQPRRVKKRPYPAIVAPKTVAAEAAAKFVRAKELVIGLQIGGESRAYPINMLCRPTREIVTDELGGERVAVTWCHLCHNALVFLASHEGKAVTLRVSGMLWKHNLVMQDVETTYAWGVHGGRT